MGGREERVVAFNGMSGRDQSETLVAISRCAHATVPVR
jgi:hypothetical protein